MLSIPISITPDRRLVNGDLCVRLVVGDTKQCTENKDSCIQSRKEECHESCGRSRYEQFVAGQRRSATSARTEPSAREDACKRHLLHRRTSNARTLAWTIPPNPRPRAS